MKNIIVPICPFLLMDMVIIMIIHGLELVICGIFLLFPEHPSPPAYPKPTTKNNVRPNIFIQLGLCRLFIFLIRNLFLLIFFNPDFNQQSNSREVKISVEKNYFFCIGSSCSLQTTDRCRED